MEGRRSPSPSLPPHPPISSKTTDSSPSRDDHDHDRRSANGASRARSPSRSASALHQQQQPIKDAVNTAFDQSPTATALDPELMKRLTDTVTEQVLKSLQANLGAGAPPRSTSIHQSRQAPRSPTQDSVDSIPARYTPPSPQRDRNRLNDSSRDSSPGRVPSEADSSYSKNSRRSRASTLSNQGKPRAFYADNFNGQREDTRVKEDVAGGAPHSRKASATDAIPRPSRRESRSSDLPPADRSSTRARSEQQSPDADETTTLEKIWQPLFDNGNPTMRLSQFLRGLAQHLIDDYEPKGSLVVTPAKMSRFFEETKLAEEYYPWSTIFGGGSTLARMSSGNLSTMYQKLLCQHHLVQTQNHERPNVPGLTPAGFENLMTVLIQAHPDKEFDRLSKAVIDMPISNADDKRERFPKELSRRLLPNQPNVQAEQRLIGSLSHEPLVQLSRANAMPPPPPPSAPPTGSFNERERNPYSSSTQRSNAFDDDDLSPPAMPPMERERKPYYAKEGGGKKYSNEPDREREREREREPPRPTASQYRPDPRTARSNSNLPPQAIYGSSTSSEPMNIPPPNNRSRMSFDRGAHPPPPLPSGGSYSKSRRPSPPKNTFARSEPVDVGSVPPSQYNSSMHSGSMRDRYEAEQDEDHSRSKSRRPERSGNDRSEDDPNGRGFPIPQRGGPVGGAGYDPSYSSGGPPPVGSFSHRGTPQVPGSAGPGPYDPRSRNPGYPPPGSMGSGNNGGSDGYGSFASNTGGYPPATPVYPSGPH